MAKDILNVSFKKSFWLFLLAQLMTNAPNAFASSECSAYLGSILNQSDSYLMPTKSELTKRGLYQSTIQSRSQKRVSLKTRSIKDIDMFTGLSVEALGLIQRDLKPLLGVMVRTVDNQMVLALGPYFEGNHQDILIALSRKFRIQTILWGGELLVSASNSKVIVGSANETSDFIAEYIKFYNHQLYGRSRFSFDFLRGVKVGDNSYKWLKAFSRHKDLSFTTDYAPVRYDLDQEHFLPIMSGEAFLKLSPEFKNHLVNLIGALDFIARDGSPAMDLDEMKSLIQSLQLYAKNIFYLSHGLNQNASEDDLIKKIKLFLTMSQVFIEEIQDFKSLSVPDIKEFQDLIIFMAKLAQHTGPNPIAFQFIRQVK
jgi:hypothetical protein